MLLNIFFIALIAVCLFFIARTIGRKFTLLANINVHELQAEKQAEVKMGLLEKRLIKKFGILQHFFDLPFIQKIKNFFKNSFAKLRETEKKYRTERQAKKIAQLNKFEKEESIREKLAVAENLLKEGSFQEAKKTYLEAVATDHKNIETYLGLAKVYLAQKDFEHAKELYEHVLKINKNNDRAFSGLGNIAFEAGELEKARDHYQKSIETAEKNPEHYLDLAMVYYKLGNPGRALTAVRRASELEPNNPKYLDFLIEAAILNKNKILALDVFNKLKNINPENQKLVEFRKRIQEL